jgi:CheY-like chemotaxis protein
MHEDSEHVSVALKPHLLVVDNERDLCLLISQYLERGGFLFSAAHTGALGAHGACGEFPVDHHGRHVARLQEIRCSSRPERAIDAAGADMR